MCYNGVMIGKRIVAFDIGGKRIGVAVSDPFNEFALPSQTYWRKGNFETDVQAVLDIAREKDAGLIVCGLPLNFDGSESIQTERTRRFIDGMRARSELPIVTEDERFTTVEAEQVLIAGGVRREKRKNSVDAIAASYILDGYLSRLKAKGERHE